MTLLERDARRLERCLAAGGVAIVPTDTVYGLACDPDSAMAVRRLYALKGRPADRPAAIMFLSPEGALQALPDLGPRERAALLALLPGPVTVLLPNRSNRFRLACGPTPEVIGLRVPMLTARVRALAAVPGALMQSSANVSGGTEARRLQDVAAGLRRGVDLELDGGELPGAASTVVDLTGYEQRGSWRIAREGPVTRQRLERVLC